MTRYYIFSNPGSKEKYTEVSVSEFVAIVRNSQSRFYISFVIISRFGKHRFA